MIGKFDFHVKEASQFAIDSCNNATNQRPAATKKRIKKFTNQKRMRQKMERLKSVGKIGILLFASVALLACCGIDFQVITTVLGLAIVGIVVAGKEIDTTSSLEDLQELRNGTVKRMGELRDKFHSRADKDKGKPGSFEGEERTEWDSLNTGIEAIDERIKTLRDSDEIEKRFQSLTNVSDRIDRENRRRNPDAPTTEDRAMALQAWFRSKEQMALSDDHIEACQRCNFNPNSAELRIGGSLQTEEVRSVQNAIRSMKPEQRNEIVQRMLEKRALSTSVATDGKEFIPMGFMNVMEEALFFHANIRAIVDIWRTDSGNEVPWPTSSDQDEGEWLAESAPATEGDPNSGSVSFFAHKIGTKVIKVPTELLEDSAFNLLTWLPEISGRRIGRGLQKAMTTGNGTGRPTGVVTGSFLGHTAAAAGALTYSDFVRLEHSVDPLDRTNGAYMFHDNILLALRLLLDGENRPLWQPSLLAGIADRFNGRPYEVNQYMDSTLVSTKKPVLFGDFKRYKLREVRGLRMYRLSELYRINDQEGFVGFQRFDGKIVNAGTNPIKHILMP